MIGIDNRTTMDMDTTIKGVPLKEEVIRNIFSEIINVEVGEGVRTNSWFVLKRMSRLK